MGNYVEEFNIHHGPQIDNFIDNSKINTIETKTDLKDILPNESCTISTEEEESEELTQMNQDNMLEAEDAVEIYSNDNIEEVSSQKTSEIDEDDIILKDAEDMGGNVINQVIEAMNEANADSLTSSISIEEINSNDESPVLLEDDIIQNNFEGDDDTIDKKVEQHISDDIDEQKIIIKATDLVKQKKLNELKEMAKQLNIELRHSDNGKAKTKKQLAEEICNLQNNQ